MEIQITPLLKESIILLGAKRTMLHKEKEGIDTVVVGSSHGDFGFNPSYFPNSFNLCRSQDLKHSFYLHRHISENYPKVKKSFSITRYFPQVFLWRNPRRMKYVRR
jgi:hypothetical protein